MKMQNLHQGAFSYQKVLKLFLIVYIIIGFAVDQLWQQLTQNEHLII